MDNTALMSSLQAFTDLLCDRQRFIDGKSVHVSDLLQRLTFNQLHHDARLRRRVFKPVNLGDIRVVQTSKDLGFALESGKTIWIISEVIRQKLQSNLTMQLAIKGTKHHTHTAFTER